MAIDGALVSVNVDNSRSTLGPFLFCLPPYSTRISSILLLTGSVECNLPNTVYPVVRNWVLENNGAVVNFLFEACMDFLYFVQYRVNTHDTFYLA